MRHVTMILTYIMFLNFSQKNGSQATESFLIQNIVNGIANDFEQSDSARRVRLVLSELLQMQAQLTEYNQNKNSNVESSIKPSELFDNEVYLEEITDVICISLAELPNLLNICEIVEVLLYVNKGPIIISWVVANMPDTLLEGKLKWLSKSCYHKENTIKLCKSFILVAESLVVNAERSEEGGIRAKTLATLCDTCPYIAAAVRAKAVLASRLPSLVINLTLTHHPEDLVKDLSFNQIIFLIHL